MRSIKFRAWNPDSRRMIYPLREGGKVIFQYNKNPTGLIARLNWYVVEGESSCAYSDRSILMQYTGLSDRYGTEIYEGDIYKTDVQTECEHCGERKVTFYVRYNHGSFGLVPVKNKHTNPRKLGSKYNLQRGEVIGNIYENPDLIQQPDAIQTDSSES